MRVDYWLKKWEANDIRFHQDRFSRKLTEFFPKKPSNAPVLVPLCGKSLDMLWLRDRGHRVLGIEVSPLACEAFFDENGLKYTESPVENGATRYDGKNISIWCGDFFEVPAKFASSAEAVYDCAALIALPPEMRAKYVTKLLSFFEKRDRELPSILLLTIDYPEGFIEGPPFLVSEDEIRERYGAHYQVTLLDRDENRFLRKNSKFEDAEWVDILTYSLEPLASAPRAPRKAKV